MSSTSPGPFAPLYALFWESSKLSPRTAEGFAAQLEGDGRTAGEVAQLFYPGPEVALLRPTDELARIMERRRSGRTFSPRALSARELGSLCHACSRRPDGGRLIASAGAKHPVELFAFLYRVESPLDGSVVYYNNDAHSLSRVAACPPFGAAAPSFGLPVESAPAALFVLVAFPERVTARYGERGGRFLLLECGYHAHALALRVAAEGLAGVETGGLHDDRVRGWLGLDATDAVIALGYAVGGLSA